jgi:serine/threonine protein kinase/Tol biopolymer transport system component
VALISGARLGPYEIVAKLGEGGMGEVYKARDTRLDRIVAVKVLPPEWINDPIAKERFDREAQTIASLKHPHICVLHDVGSVPAHEVGLTPSVGNVHFLVMEHLEGETLSDRLARGPLPLQEALGVAIAIGDALDKAHRQGVIHRDLKPSNVMLTASGPKLLDFGLAKSQAALPAATSVTLPGTILGTMQYMAPEQLDGVEADRRTDIFAFGVVVHEMVTGRKAFEGKSQVLLISAIATSSPPPLSLVQPETPAALDDLVKTCLEKDPADRWQDARDVVAELRWIAEGGTDADLAGSANKSRTTRVWLRRAAQIAGATAVILLSWPAYLHMQGSPPPEEIRFRIPRNLTAQPEETMGGNSLSGGAPTFSRADSAISPDGRMVVFLARPTPADTNVLYVRPVGAVAPQRLDGTDDATRPFWSPDSRSIAFVSRGKLKRVLATGGRPQDLCDVPGFMGGTWNRTGTILYGSPSGVYRLSEEGGTPETITTLDPSESGHFWPRFLPDGNHFLFLAKSGDASKSGVHVGALDSKGRTRLLAVDSNAIYTEPGLLIFERASTVFAQPFDAETLALSGEPTRVADEVTFESATGKGDFDVSGNGVLIYYVSSTGAGAMSEESWDLQLQWADRSAQVTASVGPWGVYRGVEVSPNGQRVAVHRHDGAGGDIWVMEPPPRAPTRITFDATQDNSSPIWSPEGDRIVFTSKRNGKWGLYETRSDGSGTDGELLLESELPKAPVSWSPDGKRLVFWVHDPKTLGDIWILPMEGDKKPVPFLVSSRNETHAQVSPNGKWIAYTSELTGRKEVYVQPFPSGTGRWQISPDAGLGGDWPRWRKDSEELYYHALGNAGAYGVYTNGGTILGPVYAASIKAVGGSVEAGTPIEALRFLAVRFPHTGSDYHTYGVSADGQKFLAFQRVLTSSSATAQIVPEVPIPGLTVAMNWAAKVRK